MLVCLIKRTENGIVCIPEIIEDRLENYYRLLECDCIDIVKRSIKGVNYSFVVDDEYLLKNTPTEPPIALFGGHNGDEAIFYRLVITGQGDQEGNLTGLTQRDFVRIWQSLTEFMTPEKMIFQALEYDI